MRLVYCRQVNSICHASFHTNAKSLIGKQRFGEKFKIRKGSSSKRKIDNIQNDDFVDMLKKAEKAVSDPSRQRLARAMDQLAKSMAFLEGKIKYEPPALKPRRAIVDVKSFSSPFVKAFTNNDSIKHFKDMHDVSNILLDMNDEELERLFLYQECLENELPFNFELPNGVTQKTFMKEPLNWESELTDVMPLKPKQLKFLMLKWAIKNRDAEKKRIAKAKRQQLPPREDDYYPIRLIPRYSKSNIGHWNVHKHVCSIHHSQPMVIDMRFHKQRDQSSSSFMTQLQHLFRRNFDSPFPYHLVLANFDENSEFYQKIWLKNKIAGIENVITTSDKPLHELEPTVKSEDLVYLSPDAPNLLMEYDFNKVYVIGGLVDSQVQKRRTRTISKTEGINSVKLPLRLYLNWGGVGSKLELSVNTVFDIMNALKHTGSWINALSHIPYRLHRGLTELGQELANNDPEVIAKFDKGRLWKTKRSQKSPPVFVAFSGNVKAARAYLGK